jgi:hypothetical protein
MLRYKLRTLLILLAVGPAMVALSWFIRSDQGAVIARTDLC